MCHDFLKERRVDKACLAIIFFMQPCEFHVSCTTYLHLMMEWHLHWVCRYLIRAYLYTCVFSNFPGPNLGCGFIPGCEKCSDGLICKKCKNVFIPVEYERTKKTIIRCIRSCPMGYNITSTTAYPKICVRTQLGKLQGRFRVANSEVAFSFFQVAGRQRGWGGGRRKVYILKEKRLDEGIGPPGAFIRH